MSVDAVHCFDRSLRLPSVDDAIHGLQQGTVDARVCLAALMHGVAVRTTGLEHVHPAVTECAWFLASQLSTVTPALAHAHNVLYAAVAEVAHLLLRRRVSLVNVIHSLVLVLEVVRAHVSASSVEHAQLAAFYELFTGAC